MKLLGIIHDIDMCKCISKLINNHTYIDGGHYFVYKTKTNIYIPYGEHYEIYDIMDYEENVAYPEQHNSKNRG